jgi:hypothetical protein
MSGTYSNGPPAPISLADIQAAAARIAAQPRVETDITVAPDAHEALRANLPSVEGDSHAGVRVHVDDRLPAGTWHRGPPMRAPP